MPLFKRHLKLSLRTNAQVILLSRMNLNSCILHTTRETILYTYIIRNTSIQSIVYFTLTCDEDDQALWLLYLNDAL